MEHDFIKRIAGSIVGILLAMIIGALVMFLISGCVSMPSIMENEPQVCYQNRYCIVGIIKTKGKDFSGCTSNFSMTCKKILIMEHCKNNYPDNQSDCREKLN